MGWRDCMSPEQVNEIDYLNEKSRLDKEKSMEEWANLIRANKTSFSLRDWLEQNKK